MVFGQPLFRITAGLRQGRNDKQAQANGEIPARWDSRKNLATNLRARKGSVAARRERLMSLLLFRRLAADEECCPNCVPLKRFEWMPNDLDESQRLGRNHA